MHYKALFERGQIQIVWQIFIRLRHKFFYTPIKTLIFPGRSLSVHNNPASFNSNPASLGKYPADSCKNPAKRYFLHFFERDKRLSWRQRQKSLPVKTSYLK